jgi:hypothetical protein
MAYFLFFLLFLHKIYFGKLNLCFWAIWLFID